MKKINEVFFSVENEKGLTQSSANHLAEMSKEMVTQTRSMLANASFINTEMAIIGHQDRILSSKGMTQEEFEQIPILIAKHGQYKAFSAWVREAIKAKEEERMLAECYRFSDYLRDFNLEMPEEPEYPERPTKPELHRYPDQPICPSEPTRPVKSTKEDVIATWNVKERMHYFRVEAVAATFGKMIHDGQPISEAVKAMRDKLTAPVTSSGAGRDTVVYYHDASVPKDQVDLMFHKLLDLHRSNEKEVNSLKFKIEETMVRLNNEREDAYRRQLEQYEADMAKYAYEMLEWERAREEVDLKNSALNAEYNAKVDAWRREKKAMDDARNLKIKELESLFETHRTNLINTVSKLKIRIPEELLEIFYELDSLGKEK